MPTESDLDRDQVRALAAKGWPVESMAAFFKVHKTTLYRAYATEIEEGRARGVATVLDLMWDRVINHKSERVLINLADRIVGPTPKALTITTEPKFASKQEAILKLRELADKLESELELEPKRIDQGV